MTATDAPFDVEAVLRKWGFAPRPTFYATSPPDCNGWYGILDGVRQEVLPNETRRFARQLLMRN